MFEVSGCRLRAPRRLLSRRLARRALDERSSRRCAPACSLPTRSSCAASPTGSGSVRGDPTEGALVVAAAKAGPARTRELDTRVPASERDPVHVGEQAHDDAPRERPTAWSPMRKGAPEVLLDSCTQQLSDARRDGARRGRPRSDPGSGAQHMAGEALRVLAVAWRSDATLANAEDEMTLLGLVGMIDPPRPEARAGGPRPAARPGISR